VPGLNNREAAAEKNENEELNNPFATGEDKESSAGGDDLVQPTNAITKTGGDDGYGSPVMPATSIPTSKVARSQKRSREAASSVERRDPRNVIKVFDLPGRVNAEHTYTDLDPKSRH